MSDDALSRAQGCLLGQFAGDSLGSLVEFRSADEIRRDYPGGVRDLTDGGTWNTLAGQPTDDSEMALMLARLLAERGDYDPERARKAYVFRLDSGPFDCGGTVSRGLRGTPDPHSQANGALMRIASLGVFGARSGDLPRVAEWARRDAADHPSPSGVPTGERAVRDGDYDSHPSRRRYARSSRTDHRLGGGHGDRSARGSGERRAGSAARRLHAPAGMGVDRVPQRALQLSHAENLEEAVVDTATRGGDTDTNAAIFGALLGSVHGRGAIPDRWAEGVLHCRPEAGRPGVHRPRPECFWPVDTLDLAERLLGGVRSCG